MLFTNGELCKYAGISAETLRHYLDLGLVSPQHISGKIRRFSMEDMADVMYVRKLRSYDLPLKEIKSLRDSTTSISQLNAQLELQRAELLRQRERIHAALNNLEKSLTYESLFDKYETPTLTINVPMISAFYDNTEESVSLVQQLESCFPHTWSAIRIPLNGIGSNVCHLGLCLDCYPEVMAALPHIDPEDFVPLGRMRVLMAKRTHSISTLTREDFAPALEYAKQHNFTVTSDIIGLILYQFTEGDQKTYEILGGVSVE